MKAVNHPLKFRCFSEWHHCAGCFAGGKCAIKFLLSWIFPDRLGLKTSSRPPYHNLTPQNSVQTNVSTHTDFTADMFTPQLLRFRSHSCSNTNPLLMDIYSEFYIQVIAALCNAAFGYIVIYNLWLGGES